MRLTDVLDSHVCIISEFRVKPPRPPALLPAQP